jgi:streptogramin lyase
MRKAESTLSRVSVFSIVLLASCASHLLTGCGAGFSAAPALSASSLNGIQGSVYGGQQPVNLSHVYVFAAGTGGYGGASQSLLTSVTTGSFPTMPDANGNYYVTTNARGFFRLTGEYSCTAGQQVYIYAVGGDSGGGSNSGLGLMAIFGTCPSSGTFASTIATVQINELTTVAAAYALAGFATDATHIADDEAVATNPYASLAKVGMANAFTNASNLVNIGTGTANTTTPGGNGTVPSTIITTLGDILASCVNSADSTSGTTVSHSGACSSLFSTATSDGTLTGTQPTDTATAAIYIAQHPGANTATLYGDVQTFPPFSSVNKQPNDFTLYITYSDASFNGTGSLAIDTSGNAWFTNFQGSTLTALTPLGVAVAGSPFSGGGLQSPRRIAFDKLGNAWVTNLGTGSPDPGSVSEFNASGSPTSISPLTRNGIDQPISVSIDGLNQVWVSSFSSSSGNGDVVAFSNSGVPLFSTPISAKLPSVLANDGAGNAWFTDAGAETAYVYQANSACTPNLATVSGDFDGPDGAAIDSNGHFWIVNEYDNSVTETSRTACELGGAQTSTNFKGNSLSEPLSLALDGAGNAWIVNYGSSSISEFSNSGTALTPSIGLGKGVLNGPDFIAADGSGDLWLLNSNNTVTEFIGLATPVITPIAAGLPSTLNTTGVSSLATRP